MTDKIDVEELRARAKAAGQGHLFRFWEGLDEAGRARLAREIADLDFERIAELGHHLRTAESASASRFEPPELFPLQREAEHEEEAREALEHGAELLSAGRVGYVLVAGGQGSRLGFEGPKGKFRVGPVTDRTLFEWHAARLAAARERHGAPVTWYVMTSATNDAETRAYFGLGRHPGVGFSVTLPADAGLEAGARVELTWVEASLRLFDSATGEAIPM